MKKSTRVFLPAYIGIHLLLHVYGAVGSPGLNTRSFVGSLAYVYGVTTGTASEFGFFAPCPGTPERAHVTLRTENGVMFHSEVILKTSEGRLRFTDCLIGGLRNQSELKSHEVMAQSIAAFLCDRYPNAHSATVTFEYMEIPGIAETKTGAAAKWVVLSQFDMKIQREER